MTSGTPASRHVAGWLAAVVIGAIYGGLAVSIDVPETAGKIWSDEATYLLMGHSLASDGDLEYRAEDLERAFEEFPSGPSGIFLKRGTDVTGVSVTPQMPFLVFGGPDPDPARLYYGKSFVYPLVAAPFVYLLGTNGFLVLNALLLAVAFFAAYLFLAARSPVWVAITLASAFVLATVVPVYAVWVQPEVFNFTVGLLAYFCWLYKFVAPGVQVAGDSGRTGWLRRPTSNVVAAALVGVVTFSKVTNALLMVPFVAWLLWRRQWREVATVSAVWVAVTAGFFGANVAVSGEWNYQGGDRHTCYAESGYYPFQEPGRGIEECDVRGRDDALGSVMFDPEVFWPTLRANVVYVFAGRNSGLVAYFFPVVFGALALLGARRRREPWQWFILAGVGVQVLFLIIVLPNTYFGGGGSVGNRYFMGVYGTCLFLMPPIRSLWTAAVPWVVGAVFMTPLVLHPFYTSQEPAMHSKVAPLRWLPVELTNVLDLPLNNERDRVSQWFGDDPEVGDLGFQIFFLDDYAYGRESESDPSFWVKGESRAEILVRTVGPVRLLRLNLQSGPIASVATVRVGGTARTVSLRAGQQVDVVIDLPAGFPYKHARPAEAPGPTYVWVVSLESSAGFTPAALDPTSPDTRFLGVRVRPMVVQ